MGVLTDFFRRQTKPSSAKGRSVGDKWDGKSSELCQQRVCSNHIEVDVEYECIDIGRWGDEWLPEVRSKEKERYQYKIGGCYFCCKECMDIYDADYDEKFVGAPKVRNCREFHYY